MMENSVGVWWDLRGCVCAYVHMCSKDPIWINDESETFYIIDSVGDVTK